MLRRRRRTLIGVGVLVLVQASAIVVYLAVRGARSGDTRQPLAVETLQPRAAPALAFEHPDKSVGTLANLRGKFVMVHFWATWCEPCRKELPGLLRVTDELARTHPFELLAVSVDDEWSEIETFFAGKVPQSIVRPEGTDVHRLFGASTLPDSYLVDAAGNLVIRYGGARDWSLPQARELLEESIDAGSPRP